jgi:hypothetical protein
MTQKLEQEFDTENNNGMLFSSFSVSSAKKVWWKCSVDPRHKWQARVFSRTQQGAGCPYCKGKKVLLEDSLFSVHPELIKEWDYSKNEIDPLETHCRSGKKVWWICSQNHEWQASITHRTAGGRDGQGTGCPYCSNQKACEDNSILTTHPELMKQWDFSKNIGISPADCVAGSHKIVWWKCSAAEDHEWEASLYNRTRNHTGCPCCCEKGFGKKVVKSNCLQATHPSITKEWHPTKNTLTPMDVTCWSNKKAWFLCKNNSSHEWECRISSRSRGDQCPFCASSKGENAIKEWLDKNNIDYKREYKIDGCVNKRRLPFDFAVFQGKKLLGLIEYQGRQHYEPIEYFGGLKSMLLLQKNDKIKLEYCKRHNIPLLAVHHTELNSINNKLFDFCANRIEVVV